MTFLAIPDFLLSAFLVFRGVFRVAIVIFPRGWSVVGFCSRRCGYSILQWLGIFARQNWQLMTSTATERVRVLTSRLILDLTATERVRVGSSIARRYQFTAPGRPPVVLRRNLLPVPCPPPE